MSSIAKTTRTRSGVQAYEGGLGRRGRKAHTTVWLPEEYDILGADGQPVAGGFCENCGKWDGPQLKRGELTRIRRGYGIS